MLVILEYGHCETSCIQVELNLQLTTCWDFWIINAEKTVAICRLVFENESIVFYCFLHFEAQCLHHSSWRDKITSILEASQKLTVSINDAFYQSVGGGNTFKKCW